MQTITQSVVESHTKLVYKYIKQDIEAENNHTAKGRVEQMGTPTEIYKNPKTPFVAQFIGESAVITTERISSVSGMQQGNHTAGICKGGQIWNRKEIPEPVRGRYRGTEK